MDKAALAGWRTGKSQRLAAWPHCSMCQRSTCTGARKHRALLDVAVTPESHSWRWLKGSTCRNVTAIPDVRAYTPHETPLSPGTSDTHTVSSTCFGGSRNSHAHSLAAPSSRGHDVSYRQHGAAYHSAAPMPAAQSWAPAGRRRVSGRPSRAPRSRRARSSAPQRLGKLRCDGRYGVRRGTGAARVLRALLGTATEARARCPAVRSNGHPWPCCRVRECGISAGRLSAEICHAATHGPTAALPEPAAGQLACNAMARAGMSRFKAALPARASTAAAAAPVLRPCGGFWAAADGHPGP